MGHAVVHDVFVLSCVGGEKFRLYHDGKEYFEISGKDWPSALGSSLNLLSSDKGLDIISVVWRIDSFFIVTN